MTNDIVTADHASLDDTDKPAIDKTDKQALCSNCGAPLGGQFCHSCGQSSKSMIKFFGDVAKELLDDTLGYDSRLKHSIFPLLFKPGRITLDYIRGKRFHYVLPFKLYLITSLLLILLIKNMINTEGLNIAEIVDKESTQESSQEIKEEVKEALDEVELMKDSLKTKAINNDIKQKKKELAVSEEAADEAVQGVAENEVSEKIVSEQVDEKTQEQQALADALAQLENIPDNVMSEQQLSEIAKNIEEQSAAGELRAENNFRICSSDNKDDHISWDNDKKELVGIDSLDDSFCKSFALVINPKLKDWIEDPKRLVDSFMEVLPYIMFIILPIFAIFLKLFYAFSRRFYTEHLVFLLHNHSFIYMVLMLQIAFDLFEDKLRPIEHWAAQTGLSIFSWTSTLLSFWMVIYVFLAMKRFYRQGWTATIFKTLGLGFIYTMMMFFGFFAALALGAYQA